MTFVVSMRNIIKSQTNELSVPKAKSKDICGLCNIIKLQTNELSVPEAIKVKTFVVFWSKAIKLQTHEFSCEETSMVVVRPILQFNKRNLIKRKSSGLLFTEEDKIEQTNVKDIKCQLSTK